MAMNRGGNITSVLTNAPTDVQSTLAPIIEHWNDYPASTQTALKKFFGSIPRALDVGTFSLNLIGEDGKVNCQSNVGTASGGAGRT